MKTRVFLRRPEVPGFCPSIGAVVTLWIRSDIGCSCKDPRSGTPDSAGASLAELPRPQQAARAGRAAGRRRFAAPACQVPDAGGAAPARTRAPPPRTRVAAGQSTRTSFCPSHASENTSARAVPVASSPPATTSSSPTVNDAP